MISMNLKYLRNKFGFSQEELAEKINVSRQTVAKWENGESLPDIVKCTELATVYNVSLDELATASLDEEVETENGGVDGKYFFGIVKVGERGQVVIPKHARNVYDIKPGDRLLALGDQRGMAFAKIMDFHGFKFKK